MKTIFSKFFAVVITLSLLAGCGDVLEEQPYTTFTTDYFKTPQGLQDAVNAVYAGLRYNYGPNGALAIANVGTDEWTYGDQPRTGADNDVLGLGTYNITTSQGSILTPWNRSFQWINSCNAVIQFAPGVSLPETTRQTLLAEARYLRAQLYMILVQQFGAVPLNLGSGNLQFNTNPSTVFYRDNVEQLLVDNYSAIIDDLIFATQNLPDIRPANAFKLSKAAAFHLLAKAYIQKGYSSASESTDFENGYQAAMELINNKAKYGVDLLANFGDVFKEGNDYNKEILFSVERMPLNNSANEVANPGSDFSNKVNIANNMFNCNYQQPSFPGASFACIPNRVLEYGRPLRRYAPTKWMLETAFPISERVPDSRFDNSFRTVWYAATLDAPGTAGYNTYVDNLATLGLSLGDTAIYLAPTDEIAAALKAIPKKYFVLGPSEFYTNQNTTWNLYPNLTKYTSTQRANFNDVSGRPFVVSRFAETYLLAAEAAMQMGDNAEAADLINVLKLRAAFRVGLSTADINARYDAIKVTPADITLDFILDERTRELAGESVRWPDLAVRGKLVERAKAHNPDVTGIQAHHVLRPIPQGQLDAISNPDPESYQNPGY